MERSGTRWLLNGNGRYRSLPFPITIPFLVIASSFFFHIHPRGFFVNGVQPLLLLAHFFELDYRDHDWSVEVRFSIVAKVLIKSGRNCILGRIEDNLFPSCEAKLENVVSHRRLEFNSTEREEFFSPRNWSRRKGCWKRRFPRISLERWILGIVEISSVFRCIIYNARLSPPSLERKETLKSLALCRIFYERKPVQLSDSSIFPRAQTCKQWQRVSLSLNLPAP